MIQRLYPTLQRGSSGYYVKLMQQILIKLAKAFHKEYEPNYEAILAPYGADGIFKVKTEQAVKAFQSVHLYNPKEKLVVDGIVGPKTWSALNWWDKNPSGYSGHNDFSDGERVGQQQSQNPVNQATNTISPSTFLKRIYKNKLVTFNDYYLVEGGGWRTINAWLKVVFETRGSGRCRESAKVKWHLDTRGNQGIVYGSRVDLYNWTLKIASSNNKYNNGDSFNTYGWYRLHTESRAATKATLSVWSWFVGDGGNAPGKVHYITVYH